MVIWLLLYLALITPVTVRIDIRWAERLDAVLAPRLWGLGPNLRFLLERTDHGHRLFRVDKVGEAKPLKPPATSARPGMTLLRAVIRGDRARELLLRGISLQQLDIALNVSLDNAARTALVSGAVQSLWRALPPAWRRSARLRVRPDFLSGQGGAQARCMVFFHLGTLLITAALLLLSYARERAARPIHPAREA